MVIDLLLDVVVWMTVVAAVSVPAHPYLSHLDTCQHTCKQLLDIPTMLQMNDLIVVSLLFIRSAAFTTAAVVAVTSSRLSLTDVIGRKSQSIPR